jgi:hypothetical protein
MTKEGSVFMNDSTAGNAMTEIALALAMAFFSIMVLTMISMGSGMQAKRQTVGINLAPAADDAKTATVITPSPKDKILIYFEGRFFDRNLKITTPTSLKSGERIILAISPDITMKEALSVRTKVNTENLIVSALDERWLKELRKTPHADQ